MTDDNAQIVLVHADVDCPICCEYLFEAWERMTFAGLLGPGVAQSPKIWDAIVSKCLPPADDVVLDWMRSLREELLGSLLVRRAQTEGRGASAAGRSGMSARKLGPRTAAKR